MPDTVLSDHDAASRALTVLDPSLAPLRGLATHGKVAVDETA